MKKSINHYAKDKSDYELSEEIIKNMNTSVSFDNPTYQPSVLSQCYVTELPEGVKFRSDVSLLLHSNTLSDQIGVDNIKRYLESIKLPDSTDDNHSYTDDQLFEMARDRRFSNINDNYNYQLVLRNEFQSILNDANSRLEQKKFSDEQQKKLLDILQPKE